MIRFDDITQLTEKGPIEYLYAAVVEGPEGEAVVGVPTGEGWQPFIVSNLGERVGELDVMLGRCQDIADATGHPVRVLRFERDAMVGEFRPGGPT